MERPRDEQKHSTALFTADSSPCSFRSIRLTVLSKLNSFLICVARDAPGYGARVDFSRGESAGRFNGLFTGTGILGML